jgi:predicted ArsR family transcriptional regulator
LAFLREVLPDARIERTSHMLSNRYYCGYAIHRLQDIVG